MDLTPSTNADPPQLPTSLISHPGNPDATNTISLDAHGHMDPTFLQSPSGMQEPPPDSRLNHFPDPQVHEAYRGFVHDLHTHF